MIKLATIVSSTIILFSSVSSAEIVLVTRGPYKITFENDSSPEKARLIAEAITSALRSVADIEPTLMDIECEDSACLKKAAVENSADNAVLVSVEESGTSYSFFALTLNERIEGKILGAFEEAKRRIANLVIKAIQNQKNRPTVAQNNKPTEASPAPAEEKTTAGETPVPLKIADAEQKPKTGAWIGLSITGASAVTWGILHTVGYAKMTKYVDKEPSERTGADKTQLENLRISTITMMGITAASFVTTGIVFFVTLHKRNSLKTASLIPVFGPDGGYLILKGDF